MWRQTGLLQSFGVNCVVVRPRPTAPDVIFQRPRRPDVAILLQTFSILTRESIKHPLDQYHRTHSLVARSLSARNERLKSLALSRSLLNWNKPHIRFHRFPTARKLTPKLYGDCFVCSLIIART